MTDATHGGEVPTRNPRTTDEEEPEDESKFHVNIPFQ